MKQFLIILLIMLLCGVAIFGLRALLIGLDAGDMAAEAISSGVVCLAAGAFFWLGGLKWFGMDSARNRLIGLSVCLAYASNRLTEYALRLIGMGKDLADMLATIVALGLMVAAILWLAQKRPI